MHVTVEFTGAARDATRQKEIGIELDSHQTFQDLIELLAKKYPALIGLLIDTNGKTFLSANMFVLNGDLATPAMVLHESPQDGDHLILMSLVTGG
jgi:molybdopterin converting factor small subunit